MSHNRGRTRTHLELSKLIFGLCGIFILPILNGCESSMRVRVTGDLSNPVFSLSEGETFNAATPCLTDLIVRKSKSSGPNGVVWHVTAVHGCAVVRTVQYLGPNQGMIVVYPPQNLAPEETYQVIGRGWGRIGECNFAFTRGQFRLDKRTCS